MFPPSPGMNDDQAAPWLPLGEAARRLGISVDAVRARVRRGQLESRRGNDGKVSVLVSDEAVAEQRLGDDQSATEQRLDRDQAEATESRLRLDLDEARAEAEHWRAKVHETELALARAEGKVEAAKAVAVADVATARAEIEAQGRLVEELRAMLAEARRPWWRRWM